MRNILTLFFCSFFVLQIVAQDLKLGKVTVDELKSTQSSIDSTAAAEYLFRKANYAIQVDSEGNYILKVEVDTKIKIYSKEGYDWANYEFPVYTGGKRVQAAYSNAFTYNLVNGKIEKTKLKSEGEFTEEVNENFELRKIKMPNVKEGSIVEFSYTYKTVYFRSFPEWFFQYQIPVVNCELTVTTPEYHQYNIHMKPYLEINRNEKVGTSPYGYKELIAKYDVKNVPAFKDEAFVTNVDNFISSVKYELASIKNPRTFEITSLASTWEDVANDIYKSESFGKELNMKGYFEEDLSKYIQENANRLDKTEAIFNFVKDRMNWNEYNGKYAEFGVKKAYKERIGNSADINLMLCAMFRSQGIKANPLITSTRSNGISYFPNVAAYNYVLVAVETEAGFYLYDATSKYASAQIIPLRALNWFGRIIYENGRSKEMDLMPVQNSKSNINGMFELNPDGLLTGKYREQMTDYNAFLFRERYASLSEEANMERIEKDYSNLEVEEYVIQNARDIYKPIVEEIKFKRTSSADVIGDKIYLNPMFMFGIKTNPFKSEKRDFPIDFVFPMEDKYMISIKIPEGYEVESLPASTILEFEDNMLGYKYQIKNVNNSIQLSLSFNINSSIIPAQHYTLVKDFFNKLVEKNNEKVVLKKI
jgi:hypothetical protein